MGLFLMNRFSEIKSEKSAIYESAITLKFFSRFSLFLAPKLQKTVHKSDSKRIISQINGTDL